MGNLARTVIHLNDVLRGLAGDLSISARCQHDPHRLTNMARTALRAIEDAEKDLAQAGRAALLRDEGTGR